MGIQLMDESEKDPEMQERPKVKCELLIAF